MSVASRNVRIAATAWLFVVVVSVARPASADDPDAVFRIPGLCSGRV